MTHFLKMLLALPGNPQAKPGWSWRHAVTDGPEEYEEVAHVTKLLGVQA
jgi:hypothetical protein